MSRTSVVQGILDISGRVDDGQSRAIMNATARSASRTFSSAKPAGAGRHLHNESGVVFPAKQQDGKQDQNNPDNLYDRHALA